MKFRILLGLSLFILSSTTIFSQSRLKGNKIVFIENREVSSFNNIEVSADVDVYLFQGDNNLVSVETDENLQNAVRIQVDNNTLKINFSNKISRSKKMNVFITVTNELHTISAYKNANIYADSRLILKKLTINAFENADFKVKIDADEFKINGFKNTDLVIDVFSKNLEANISESCELKLNGEIDSLKTEIKNKSVLTAKGKGVKLEIEARNNGTFKGEFFEVKYVGVDASGRTNLKIDATEEINITASNNANITVYHQPKIDLVKFIDKATLHQKKK